MCNIYVYYIKERTVSIAAKRVARALTVSLFMKRMPETSFAGVAQCSRFSVRLLQTVHLYFACRSEPRRLSKKTPAIEIAVITSISVIEIKLNANATSGMIVEKVKAAIVPTKDTPPLIPCSHFLNLKRSKVLLE